TEPEVAEKEALAKMLDVMATKIVDLEKVGTDRDATIADLTARLDKFGSQTPDKKFNKQKPDTQGTEKVTGVRKF
ncbi:hypothetical protein N9251_03450, partial [Gammaproteobacteria bacterium]|nr:hypothetical protein [Gammaproteobacteria bacterium]